MLGSALVEAGCSRQDDDPWRGIPIEVTVLVGDETYQSASAAELRANFGPAPSLNFSVVAGSHKGFTWGLFALPSIEQVQTGHVTLSLMGGLISGVEVGHLTLDAPDGTREEAAAGTVDLTIAGGRITGTVTADPPKFSAIIDGASAVSCWVPATILTAADQDTPLASGDNGGGRINVVQDVDLASPNCRLLALWRGP